MGVSSPLPTLDDLKNIIRLDTRYAKLVGWDFDVHALDIFGGTDVKNCIITFYMCDVLLWSVIVVIEDGKFIRSMRSFNSRLFRDCRKFGRHDIVLHNQWIGGGYACSVVYGSIDDLFYDIALLTRLTIDTSRNSNLSTKTPPKKTSYSIDMAQSMLIEPPEYY